MAGNDLFMGDMADPGTLVVKEDAVAFYIGGYTPHVWTTVQINRQTAKYRHPIWVYDPNHPGLESGIVDGTKAVQQCRALKIPALTTISFDMETSVDAAYLNGVHSVVGPSGYWTGVYGSLDFITQNPVFGGGRWVAHWTGTPHLTGVPGEWACQYQKADAPGDADPWDLSLIDDPAHLWDPTAPEREVATLVRLPSGAASTVYSVNGGVTWQA